MEDLTPAERARRRLQEFRASDGDEPEGDTTDTDPRERALQRLDALMQREDRPDVSIDETRTFMDEADAGGDGAPGDEGGFDPAEADPDAQAKRMQALGRLFEERRNAPENLETELASETEPQNQDPGVEPGDESESKEDRRQRLVLQAAETAAEVSAALTPGTQQQYEMVKATWNGLKRQYQQLRSSGAAMKLLSEGTIEGGISSVPVTKKEIETLGLEGAETTTEEREQAAVKYLEANQRLQELGQPEAVTRAQESPSIFGAIKEVAKDPTTAIPNLVASSAAHSAPPAVGAMLGAPAGPAGMFAGQFMGTLASEQRAAMSNLLAESGVDISDPRQILAATADPHKRREIKRKARNRGLAVGAVDGLFGAVTAGLHRVGMSPIVEGATGFAIETVGEGVAERAGQFAAGEEYKPSEVAMEAVAALGQSGVTSAASVAANQLTQSEQRLADEIRRQLDEETAEVEVPESMVSKMLKRAVDQGGLERPQASAEQVINDAIRAGEIQVEPAETQQEEGDASPTQERLDDIDEQTQQPDEQTPTEGTEDVEPATDEAGTDQAGPVSRGDGGRAGRERAARREPSTPRQRLEQLGIDPEQVSTHRDDVAELERRRSQIEEMNTADLEQNLSQAEERLEQAMAPPEEREGPVEVDVPRLRALRQMLEDEVRNRETEQTGDREPDAEPEVPEPGEGEAFAGNVENADPEQLQALAQNDELTGEQAEMLRGEVETRLETGDMDEAMASDIQATLAEQEPADEDVSDDTADRPGEEEQDDQAEDEADTDEEAEAEPEETTPPGAPAAEELEEGAEFVDVGGIEPRRVTLRESASAESSTVEVDKEGQDDTFQTTALLSNLRRPSDVEDFNPPGSTFPVADVDESGTADLSEEFQIVPENATIPEDADVRHDYGTSDLPVARIAPEEEAEGGPQDLSEIGRRTPIRQEERIEQEVQALERELDQAKSDLENLKGRMPESEQQTSTETGSLFGEEEQGQTQGQQQALGDQFEASDETTQQLQQMIDEQREYVNRLQQELIDARRRAPDAKSDARQAQSDIADQIETEQDQATGPPQGDGAPQAPTRSAADLTTAQPDEISTDESRQERAEAIRSDLQSVLQLQWQNDEEVQARLQDVARSADHIRELRAATQRGDASRARAEDDVASMRDHIDTQVADLDGRLADEEVRALRSRVREWTSTTGTPEPASKTHLNRLGGNQGVGPRYTTADGYEVRTRDDGGLEVLSPNTGSAIDRRSSRYNEVVLEYFTQNSRQIDESTRVTNRNPNIPMGQWLDAVATSSRNPFEIIEAIVVEQGRDSFDPIVLRLVEAGRLQTSSLEPFISSGSVIEQGLGNWVTSNEDARAIENVARDISREFGMEVTPQQIVDEYILENPGGPRTIETSKVPALVQQFENVTGLSVDLDLLQEIYDSVYETRTEQTTDDQGLGDVPSEPETPYIHSSTNRRSNLYERTAKRYRRRTDGRSLEEIVRDGYELREAEPEQSQEDGVALMEQLSLFGPTQGTAPGMQTGPNETPSITDQPTTEFESELTRPTEEELERIDNGLLGRGITDDLAENHGASLVGRTVTGPDDLAALAQIYRDPRFETLRIFFVRENDDGSEEIVHQTGVSSRLPGMTSIFPAEIEGTAHIPDDVPADELDQWGKMHYWMAHQMGEAGADGFYLLHNHPSGRTTPSTGDEAMTARMALEGQGFRGHVIIDSGEYRVLDVASEGDVSIEERRAEYRGAVEAEMPGSRTVDQMRRSMVNGITVQDSRREISDPEVLRRAQIDPQDESDQLLQPSIKHPALEKMIAGDDDLISIAQEIHEDTDAPILILRGSNGRVRGLMELDRTFIETASVRQMSRQVLSATRINGATKAFIANVPSDHVPQMSRFLSQGIIRDFVTQGGKSSTDYNVSPNRSAVRNQFGFTDEEIGTVPVREDDAPYGDNLRDEIRRRVGRLQHETPQQQDPAPDSGPTDAEEIRQAAVRVGDQLYRGATHPEALQAAINEGALEQDGTTVTLPDGTSLQAAEESGRVRLGLYTTSENRVVARQSSGHVLGVGRADMTDVQRRPQPPGPLEAPPPADQVAQSLAALETREARLEATEDLPETANAVDVTLAKMPDDREQNQEIHTELTDKALNRGNPISAPEVINSFLDVVRATGRETPLRYGRYRGFSFSTSGVFKIEPEVIRLREANDIPTAAHEMGHALEKAVFGWVDGSPWRETVAGTDGQVQEELVQLGRDLYGDTQPNGGYKREGWAEFMKFYLLDRGHLEENAPAVLDWFENTFLEENPGIANAMETARQQGRTWYDQGAINRAQASIERNRSWWEDFKEQIWTETGLERLKTHISQAMLTEFSPILRLVEEAESRMGENLPVDENPFLTAEALQKTHAARTRMFVEQGTFDFAGNPVGPPLRDAAQAVGEENRDEFTLYLWARRALKLWEGREAKYDDEGNLIQTEKEPRNPGLSKEDAEYIFDYYDSLEFRQAAEAVYQWNNEVLDYTKAAFDPQMAEQVKHGDVGDYIPLQRVFGELNQAVVEARDAAGGSTVLGTDPINALRGSTRRIRDPFQTMIEQAEQLIRATHQRYILNQLIKIGENVPGMGRFVERVPRDQVPTRVSTERVIEDLRDEGLVIDLPRDELNAKIERLAEAMEDGRRDDLQDIQDVEEAAREELMNEKIGGFMTFFKPAIVPEGTQDPIVPIQDPESGDVRWYELSRELYDTFQGLDIYRLPWYLDIIFGTTARMFRLGVTGVRASFALITNPARDFQVLFAQSRSVQNPGNMFMGYLQSMRAGLMGVLQDENEVDPSFARFMRLGGSIARPLGVDTQETKRAAREVFQDRTTRLLTPSNWIDHLRDVFQIPETGTRVAEFKARAEEIGWEEGTKMSDSQALQLLLDSKRVTTDFTSQGKYTKVGNQMVPFVTATIGGQRAFFRAFKQNPKRAIAAATTMVSATMGYWWLRKDEEWYKDLPYREKFNNWFFPIGEDGPVLVLPRPFEWGVTFSALPEAMLDAWYNQDPESVDAAIGHLYKNWSPLGTTDMPEDFGGGTLPFGMPVPLQVGAEQLANEQFYFDQPIVPRGEQQKPAAEQFGPYTSTVAIQVGRIFDVSPRRIDHLIAGFFGGVGRDATQALDGLLSTLGIEGASPNVTREQTAADIPVFGELFRAGGKAGYSSKTIDDFYNMLEEKQRLQASDVKTETPVDRQTRLMLQDAQKALSLLFWLRNQTADADTRQNIQVEARRIADDAMEAARAGREEVLRKRGQLRGMRRLERQTGELEVEQMRDLIDAVSPVDVEEEEEQQQQQPQQ